MPRVALCSVFLKSFSLKNDGLLRTTRNMHKIKETVIKKGVKIRLKRPLNNDEQKSSLLK